MKFLNRELMYEFRTKDLLPSEAIKQFADHIVKESKAQVGWDTDVQIQIEPKGNDVQSFSVSMSVFGLGEPIVINKEGKNLMSVLRKVRKGILREIRGANKRRNRSNRKQFWRTQFIT